MKFKFTILLAICVPHFGAYSIASDVFNESIDEFFSDENNKEIQHRYDRKHGKNKLREAIYEMMNAQNSETNSIPNAAQAFSSLTLFEGKVRSQALSVYKERCKGDQESWPCEALNILKTKEALDSQCKAKNGAQCFEQAEMANELGFTDRSLKLSQLACKFGHKQGCEKIQEHKTAVRENEQREHERRVASEQRAAADAEARRAYWNSIAERARNTPVDPPKKKTRCISRRSGYGEVETVCD